MMNFDAEKVLLNARQAATEDLLDRVTVFREGMEPEAVVIIENELRERGIRREQIEAHGEQRRREVLLDADGTAAMCSFCREPAVEERWGWHRLWGVLPLFPRVLRYCREHRPH
jgi:hypothetical protein